MVDIAELRQNEFWRKKIRAATHSRDVDKSGTISRADFQLVIGRYKKLESSTPESVERLSKMFLKVVDQLGLADAREVLSYDEFEERWMAGIAKGDVLVTAKTAFKEMFNYIDTDGNGFITYNEWKDHYIALGIPVEYARASFDAMDVDKDGKITNKEFANYHMEYFYSTENKLNSAILYGPF